MKKQFDFFESIEELKNKSLCFYAANKYEMPILDNLVWKLLSESLEYLHT